jgi:hypothetical protein
MKSSHGWGGGLNKIIPREEKMVVALAKRKPDWHCRRIAYHLDRKLKDFIGKTKIAEIMCGNQETAFLDGRRCSFK